MAIVTRQSLRKEIELHREGLWNPAVGVSLSSQRNINVVGKLADAGKSAYAPHGARNMLPLPNWKASDS